MANHKLRENIYLDPEYIKNVQLNNKVANSLISNNWRISEYMLYDKIHRWSISTRKRDHLYSQAVKCKEGPREASAAAPRAHRKSSQAPRFVEGLTPHLPRVLPSRANLLLGTIQSWVLQNVPTSVIPLPQLLRGKLWSQEKSWKMNSMMSHPLHLDSTTMLPPSHTHAHPTHVHSHIRFHTHAPHTHTHMLHTHPHSKHMCTPHTYALTHTHSTHTHALCTYTSTCHTCSHTYAHFLACTTWEYSRGWRHFTPKYFSRGPWELITTKQKVS